MLVITRKEKIDKLEAKNNGLSAELKKLEIEINSLKEKIKRQESNIDIEYSENYKQHKKLKEIDEILDEPDYGSITNLKNRIKTVIHKEELVSDDQSEN